MRTASASNTVRQRLLDAVVPAGVGAVIFLGCQIFGHRHVVMVLIVALVPVLIVYSSSIARDPRWGALSTRRPLSVWTDDFSNLFTVLKWHFS